MNKNVEINLKEVRTITAAIPEDIAEMFIADLENSLRDLDNRRRSIQSAIHGLRSGRNSGAPAPIIPVKKSYKKRVEKHVVHPVINGKLGNQNRKGKKSTSTQRYGLLDKIINSVRNSNMPLTSGQVKDVLVKEYGYKNKKDINSLESSVAAILYQYTTGNGGMKQIFERTEGDRGAYIYSIRKGN